MARKKPKPTAKKPTPKPAAAAKGKPAPAPTPTIVVFYELRGLTGVRYHSEHAELARAQLAARHLISSSDVDQAWVIQHVEIFRAGN
jgi:hypothetical protein